MPRRLSDAASAFSLTAIECRGRAAASAPSAMPRSTHRRPTRRADSRCTRATRPYRRRAARDARQRRSPADFGDAADNAGRRLVVDDRDGLDPVRAVVGAAAARSRQGRRRGASRPRRRRPRGRGGAPLRSTARRNGRSPASAPYRRARACSRTPLPIRRYPTRERSTTGSASRTRAEAVERFARHPRERPAAMVDRRLRERAQHAIRNVGRTGDLEKMAAGAHEALSHDGGRRRDSGFGNFAKKTRRHAKSRIIGIAM